MATTAPDGLPYPTDYAQPADVPAALESLANSTQTGLTARAYATDLSSLSTSVKSGAQRVWMFNTVGDPIDADGVWARLTANTGNPSGITITNNNYLTLPKGMFHIQWAFTIDTVSTGFWVDTMMKQGDTGEWYDRPDTGQRVSVESGFPGGGSIRPTSTAMVKSFPSNVGFLVTASVTNASIIARTNCVRVTELLKG